MNTVDEIIKEEEEAADVLHQREQSAAWIKEHFPMLYTPKGNVRKRRGFRVSGKNAVELINMVTSFNHQSVIKVHMPAYDIHMSLEASRHLKLSGLITELLLNGYALS